MSVKHYYEIAKPGMVYGNAIPVVCSFIFAAKGHIDWRLFIAMLIGISLVMASGCVFNNLIDKDIDAKMQRTMKRVLVMNSLSDQAALIYGSILGMIGFATLAIFTNLLATLVAVIGFLFYVFMYSLWWKRRSPWGTIVGSVSGAVPAVVGYAAATGSIDLAALMLFAIMTVWQMPHFYAIAIRRKDEYAAAGIPVLSVVKSIGVTKRHMLGYIIAFVLISPLLYVFGYSNIIYLAISLALGLSWLILCLKGFRIPDTDPKTITWAKNMFLSSLVVMITLFVAIAVTYTR